MADERNYENGRQDGLKLYAEACSRQENCNTCPLGVLAGSNVTCQEYIKTFPQKAVGILTDMLQGSHTYYDEFVARFPHCNIPVAYMSKVLCRKLMFEGYCECDNESISCKECWKETYTGDITGVENQYGYEVALSDEVLGGE